MMRPTASSASKTHEKIETKSPPRRTGTVSKPKRKSEPKTESKENGAAVEASDQPASQDGGHQETQSQDAPAAHVETVGGAKEVRD